MKETIMSNQKRQRTLKEIWRSPDKYVYETSNSPTGTLARMVRGMFGSYGVNVSRGESLMNEYINDPRNGIPQDRKAQLIVRGGLSKGLASDEMSWKTLIKALHFIKAKKFKITIEIWRDSNRSTIHEAVVNLDTSNREQFQEDSRGEEEGNDEEFGNR